MVGFLRFWFEVLRESWATSFSLVFETWQLVAVAIIGFVVASLRTFRKRGQRGMRAYVRSALDGLMTVAVVFGIVFICSIPYTIYDKNLIAQNEIEDASGEKERLAGEVSRLEKELQVGSKESVPMKEAPAPSVSAPGGIAIGRDNLGTAIVQNYTLPSRRLTEGQMYALERVAESMPSNYSERLYMLTANEPEAIRFGDEIYAIFKRHRKAREHSIVFGWSGAIPKGLFVLVHSKDDEAFPIAQQIANALGRGGTKPEFTRGTSVKPGEICIVVGTRPES